MRVTKITCTACCAWYISCHNSTDGRSRCGYYNITLNEIYHGSIAFDCNGYEEKP